jgi:hypothetical protein
MPEESPMLDFSSGRPGSQREVVSEVVRSVQAMLEEYAVMMERGEFPSNDAPMAIRTIAAALQTALADKYKVNVATDVHKHSCNIQQDETEMNPPK